MRKFSLWVVVCGLQFAGTCLAQTMVLHDDRSKDSVVSTIGPNMNKFSHIFIGGGLVASGDEAGARIKYGSSGDLTFGLREKFKISPVYSMGFDVFWDYSYYKLLQEPEKKLPDSITHSVERMNVYGIGLTFYNRFNFDPRRGNYMGTYLDLGVSGSWLSSFNHFIKDTIETRQSKLPYTNKFSCDLIARLGRGRYALYAHYRLTDLFKSQYQYPELPRLIVGLELGLFR